MRLHWCWLLGGFSDSQSWAQQSEIKKQNQKHFGRGQSESRVLRDALGALLWRACRLGGGMLSPRTRGPSVPSQITPNSANLREHHCATCWRPEALKTTPPLTPQVHLPGRCAPDNQHHGPSPDPTQTIRCHQVVRPKRLQSFSAAWKEGSSFLCILCFIFIYFFILFN